MRIGRPTPLEAEYLAKLGLPGLANFELPDAAFAQHLEILRRQHGVKRHGVEHHDEATLRARAIARAAHDSYGRKKLEEQAPHPYLLQMNRRLNIALVCIILAILTLAVFAVKGHAQGSKPNPGPAARANMWFWNGTAYVPVEAAAPLPITCNNCSGSGLSVVDNTAFTAGTSPFIPIGGWYSSTPTDCTDGRECTALMTLTRHLWTTCDNCSSSSFTDLAVFTPTSTAVGFAGCFFQTTPTNNPLTNLTGGAPQCTANRELYTAFRTTPTVNIGTFANTLGVTQSTNPWVVSVPTWAGGTLGAMANYGTSPGAVLVPGVNAFVTNIPAVTQSGGPWTFDHTKTAGQTLGAIANYGTSPGAVPVEGTNAFVTNNVAVTLSTETTKVIGTVNQGTSPWVVSQSGTWTVQPGNTANTTAWLTRLNDGSQSITAAISAWGTAPTGTEVQGVNADQFISGVIQGNDGTAGFAGVGGHFADNGVAAATNRLPTLDCIYQTSYLNGTAATQGRNGAQSCGTDGLLWTASLPSIRPASYHWSASFAGSSTTAAAHIAGNATNTLLLTGIRASCTATTAGIPGTWTITKTSAASTGGTAATMTAIPDDSNYAAASSVAQSFTGTGPTVGTPVGQVDAYKLDCNATGTAGPNDIYISPAWMRTKPIVLRGTAQTVEVGFGAAVTGGNYTVTFEGIETATILP